jgi:hypothetical protein
MKGIILMLTGYPQVKLLYNLKDWKQFDLEFTHAAIFRAQ